MLLSEAIHDVRYWMDPKYMKPGSKDLEVLELTLTQDIELPFDDEIDTRDERLQQDDLETP